MLTRGGKTAAEKVVREFENGADLGSPDKRESIPPLTDMQDSPVFKFLCNLSPIKPAKTVHHAQTYNELTFPPEPRIFASPRSARRSSSSSLKRVVAAERLSALAQAEGRESLTWQSSISRGALSDNAPSPSPLSRRSDDRLVTLCSRIQTEQVPASQSSGENLVGQGMFAMNSTQLNSEPTNCETDRIAATTANFQTQFTDYQPLDQVASAAMPSDMARYTEDIGEKPGGARSERSDPSERRQSTSSLISQTNDSVMPSILSQESKCAEYDDQRRVSMTCSSVNEDHGFSYSPIAKGSLELDQDTAAMTYLLAGNRDVGQINGKEWSENSSEVDVSRLPYQAASVSSENQADTMNEGTEKQERRVLDAMTSQSGFGASTDVRRDTETNLTTEDAGREHSLPPQRADTAGQRGFRRRCLDFDVARRKSFGSMGGRKSLGSRLKDCSGIDGNNTSVLGDGMRPASDATRTRVQIHVDASRTATDSVMHTGGVLAREDNLGTMTRMQQLTNSTYQNKMDIMYAKTGESHARNSQYSGVTPGVNSPDGVRRSPRVHKSGIGLHLNSLTSSMSFKRNPPSTEGESSKGVLATVLGLQPLTSPSPREDSGGEGLSSAGYPANLNQSFNSGMGSSLERRIEIETNSADAAFSSDKKVVIPTPDFTGLNIENLAPLEDSLPLTPVTTSPRDQERSQPYQQELTWQAEGEVTHELLDSPQSSKNRRLSRRKSTASSQGEKPGDGCKRCNCKKSKCLKLYCECFAAREFCVGSCACRNCFNKPEYEATVLNTRQQIESRNPLAFAPKIVQAPESSPIPGDEALDTPASARHKRGCNCKKSLCLKKYCECYQAGVGCSEGCRCEGCRNMYGRKEGPEEGEAKEKDQVNLTVDKSQAEDPIELFNSMSGKPDRLRDHGKSNPSPITPTFEYDGLGEPMSRLRSTGRKRASSDDQCGSPLAQPASRPPKSPTRFSSTLDAFDLVPYPQEDTDFSICGAGDSPMTTPTFARIAHISRWEGLSDLSTLTPLSMTTLQPTPGSCVTTERPDTSPAFTSQMTETSFHSASATSAHHHASSRIWSSQIPEFRHPDPQSPNRFDTPHQAQLSSTDDLDSTTRTSTVHPGKNLHNELESVKTAADDDGTPYFLKYGDDFSSPTRSTVTKSNSPKQKRVTPPRYADSRDQASSGGCGNSLASPPGLRNTKKFILQALPSLPSAAPSSFSNG
ncbi:uncharacterized protein [Physcomitrium patens]|uniref:CRC domain-containing protein n=2 Tax=Physcomitrium patens TaxID=3218 RepID=A0A2K1J2K2_PHYPA|nr:uncharacterized protein LOC112294496 [Physcomitrium patens]PNR35754.1 hypothetical protein PHYPA_021604 [Physcomitrium patens]|eukprot:XP_024400757.1 uncharacterized protein LOC112294496 [Physcomitrella patens]